MLVDLARMNGGRIILTHDFIDCQLLRSINCCDRSTVREPIKDLIQLHAIRSRLGNDISGAGYPMQLSRAVGTVLLQYYRTAASRSSGKYLHAVVKDPFPSFGGGWGRSRGGTAAGPKLLVQCSSTAVHTTPYSSAERARAAADDARRQPRQFPSPPLPASSSSALPQSHLGFVIPSSSPAVPRLKAKYCFLVPISLTTCPRLVPAASNQSNCFAANLSTCHFYPLCSTAATARSRPVLVTASASLVVPWGRVRFHTPASSAHATLHATHRESSSANHCNPQNPQNPRRCHLAVLRPSQRPSMTRS